MCLPLSSWSARPLSSSSLHEAQKELDSRRWVQSPQQAADTWHAAACRSGEALRRPRWTPVTNRLPWWGSQLHASARCQAAHLKKVPKCCCSHDTGAGKRHSTWSSLLYPRHCCSPDAVTSGAGAAATPLPCRHAQQAPTC